MKIATIAVPLSGNKGSASMAWGLMDAFAHANIAVDFAVFSYYPGRDRELAAEVGRELTVHPGHPKHLAFQLIPLIVLHKLLPRAVPTSWKIHIRALQSADVVLLVGGTTFADSMLFKVPWNVLAALPAFLLGRPVVFASQTLGPARQRLNRFAARWTLRRSAEVHGRGPVSTLFAANLEGVNATYRPDLSFAMQVPPFESARSDFPILTRFTEHVSAAGQAAVGVAPNAIVHAKAEKSGIDYVGFLAGVVREVSRHGFVPVLIPHSYREDTARPHNNDRALCLAVLDRLEQADRDLVFYLDADLPPQHLRSLIGELHILVASRFHSMVSALAMCVPPITYGWGAHKYSEVLDEFELTDSLYVPYEDMKLETFVEKLEQVASTRDELATRISYVLPAVVEGSRSLPGDLAERYFAPKRSSAG